MLMVVVSLKYWIGPMGLVPVSSTTALDEEKVVIVSAVEVCLSCNDSARSSASLVLQRGWCLGRCSLSRL